jgi:hypothetical protein
MCPRMTGRSAPLDLLLDPAAHGASLTPEFQPEGEGEQGSQRRTEEDSNSRYDFVTIQ